MAYICGVKIEKSDKVLVMGSCFAGGIGERLAAGGRDVCLNPFGTLFNPVSIRRSLDRLRSGEPFTRDECVRIGAGSDLWCSFSHYTKFGRPSPEEFLSNANESLARASEFYRSCSKLILTFGTAFCFRNIADGKVVSNCLKRPAREFERFRLGIDEIVELYFDLDKEVLFTVSPIRHLADTAHGNQLSKSTLLLAVDRLVAERPELRSYFPAYEILLDELRDYSWYAEDKVHPSEAAVDLICKRFVEEFCL